MALLLLLSLPISFVVALNYVAAQMLLTGAPEVAAFTDAQREAMGMLVIRSRFLPRVLGVLLIIASVAYVGHSVASLLMAGHRIILYERVTMLARAAGEFPIMLWLVIKGADARQANSRTA